jgi:hypothetical protein
LYEITHETIDFFGLFSVYRPLDLIHLRRNLLHSASCILVLSVWLAIVLEQLSFGFVVSAFFTISYPIAISIWIQWIRTICSFLTITYMHLSLMWHLVIGSVYHLLTFIPSLSQSPQHSKLRRCLEFGVTKGNCLFGLFHL